MAYRYDIESFVDPATDLKADYTAAARRFIEANGVGGWELALQDRELSCFPEAAAEHYATPSNNDAGLKKSPFLLRNVRDAIVDGCGARLLMRGTPAAGRGSVAQQHAYTIPVLLDSCEDIVLRNFSIDWATPYAAQGLVTNVNADAIDIEVRADCRWWTWTGRLYFDLEGVIRPLQRVLAVYQGTGGPVRQSADNCGGDFELNWFAERLDERYVRLRGPARRPPEVGQVLILSMVGFDTGCRPSPAIFFTGCRNVTIENVTLHHAVGMGVLGQLSEGIRLRNVVAEPRPDSGRLFSLTADATHFVNCRGTLVIENCRFQNQFDDGVNVHGNYAQVLRKVGARTVRARRAHAQHQGFPLAGDGDTLEFVDTHTAVASGSATVVGVRDLNSETCDITFASPLPDTVGDATVLDNLSRHPDVTVRASTFRHNRARGILMATKGAVLIEECTFENAGSAIAVIAHPNGCYESGTATNVKIRGNRFTDCCHTAQWGAAAVTVGVSGAAPDCSVPVFRNIAIENNTFVSPNGLLLDAARVDGLVFRGNVVEGNASGPLVRTRACLDVHIDEGDDR